MTGFYKDYADSSDTHQNSAEASADAAEASKLIAQSAASTATTKAVEATTAAEQAEASADEAEVSANEAATSASEAATSLAAQEDLEVTSASFDTTDGTLTLTKANSGTVTADLDGRYAELTGADFTGDVSFGDDVKAKFGTDSDLLIYHNDGEPSVIEDAGELGLVLKTNGNVFAVASDTNENMITAVPDGGVSLYYDNELRFSAGASSTSVPSGVDFSVSANTLFVDSSEDKVGINKTAPSEALDVDGNIAVSGFITGANFSDAVSFGDNIKAKFGDNDDLLIYHNTTGSQESVIEDTGTGGLNLKSNGNGVFLQSDTQNIISAYALSGSDSYASLFYSNSERLKTISDGVDVTGDIIVSGTVDGVDIATLGANAIVDGDFTSNGFMKRTGVGTYEIDNSAYLTSYTETNDLSTAVTWANVPDANITESSVTQYLTAANVTSAGALMDSEVTNLAQVKAFDSSDYATSAQGTTADNALPKAGGQMTGNITFSGTQTVDGRDLSVDGTKLDGITSEASASYNYTTQLYQGYLNLTTAVNQVGPDFYLRNYSDNHYKRFAEVAGSVSYSGLSSTNDLNLRTILVVPSDSGSAVDIGSVDSITTTSTYNRDIVIVGDVSHWFSEYSGTALNSNGTSTFSSIVSAIYNPTTNKTTINAGVFGITPPSVGDSIYVHPFDWESAGTEIYGVIKQLDADNESTMSYEIYNKVYFGNIDRVATCRIKLYEAASSDSIVVQRLRVYQLDERA
jgi:hypothetical protein